MLHGPPVDVVAPLWGFGPRAWYEGQVCTQLKG